MSAMATTAAAAAMPETALSDTDFARFRKYFYRKTGIFFPDSKRYFVDKRLLQRLQETGYNTFREYYMFMRFQASQAEF